MPHVVCLLQLVLLQVMQEKASPSRSTVGGSNSNLQRASSSLSFLVMGLWARMIFTLMRKTSEGLQLREVLAAVPATRDLECCSRFTHLFATLESRSFMMRLNGVKICKGTQGW